MSFQDTFTNLGNQYGGMLATVGSIAGALDNAGDIRDLGYSMQQHMENMGNQLNTGSQFQGYGVTSGLGTSTVGKDGSINMGMGPSQSLWNGGLNNVNAGAAGMQNAMNMNSGQTNTDWNQMANQYLGMGQGITPNTGWGGEFGKQAAGLSMADPSQRQQEIFNQIMAVQNPMLDQQQAQQQAREYAMGRGGVAGSAFGGTAEDAAMAKARAQASNQAVISAMQQADNERNMYGQMASQYGQLGNQTYQNMMNRENALNSIGTQLGQLGNQAFANNSQYAGMLGQLGQGLANLGFDQSKLAYMPMQMQAELLKLAQGTGGQAQTGQLTGQDYLAQMLTGGINANVNAQKVSSELMGNLYDSILDNLGGASGEGGSVSGIGALGGLFGGLLDKIVG